MATGKRWLRRLGYIVFILIWLPLILFPAFAFTLAGRGQLQLGGENLHVRFFLVQEEEADGIGMEWVRPSLRNKSCRQTTVLYYLWEGENNPNTSFCQCTDPATGAPLPIGSGCQ